MTGTESNRNTRDIAGILCGKADGTIKDGYVCLSCIRRERNLLLRERNSSYVMGCDWGLEPSVGCVKALSAADFKAQMLSHSPSSKELRIRELAEMYHEYTDAYDNAICTGALARDNKTRLPATSTERRLINANAKQELVRLYLAYVQKLGATLEEWRRAVSNSAPVTTAKTEKIGIGAIWR